jgi:hypothetical protein
MDSGERLDSGEQLVDVDCALNALMKLNARSTRDGSQLSDEQRLQGAA